MAQPQSQQGAFLETSGASPFKSKKFLAYLVAELTSKFLLAGGLFLIRNHIEAGTSGLWWWMMTLTICVTFLEVGAILGIAYVDRYSRLVQVFGRLNPKGLLSPKDAAAFEVPPDLKDLSEGDPNKASR